MSKHIAHMNWGRLLFDWDDPRVAEFVDNLDLVNGIAARAKGFVWRMNDSDMEAVQTDSTGVFGDDPLVASTLSVWETNKDLSDFVHHTVHAGFMAKVGEWQEQLDETTYVLWPIDAGHRPDMIEAKEKLDMLAANGPSAEAYDFAYLNKLSKAGVAA